MYRDEGREDRSVLVLTLNNRVLGLDARTGAIRWEVELGFGVARPIELVIHRGHVYACGPKQISCIEYATGRVVGEAQLPQTWADRPSVIVQDDLLFVAGNGEVACLDLTGRLLWHEPLKGRGYGRMAMGFPGNVRQADDAGSR